MNGIACRRGLLKSQIRSTELVSMVPGLIVYL